MSLRKPGKGTRAPHGRGIPVQCLMARVSIERQPRCQALKRNGEPCRNAALSGTSRCGSHGGFGILARRGLYRSRSRG
jgi:hypothetical protein